MLVGRIGCSQLCIVLCGITDTRQRTITQQVRNVTQIAGMYLFVGVSNGGSFVCRILQLEDTERNTIDKEKYIRNTNICLHAIAYLKLVDHPKDVIRSLIKVNIADVERLIISVPYITVAVTYKFIRITQQLEVALSTDVTQMVDNLFHIVIGQVLVLILQIGTQIVRQKNFTV